MINMRYIDKDKDGNVTGVFMREQYEGQEQVEDDNVGLLAYIDGLSVDPNEEKIRDEITKLNRIGAIQSLKDKGELPIDYDNVIMEV